VALAEATPEDKFAWRPAAGVRSTSEVYMHIAIANFWLLSNTGVKLPADLKINDDTEKKVTAKADALKAAELALANARADAFARLQASPSKLAPD